MLCLFRPKPEKSVNNLTLPLPHHTWCFWIWFWKRGSKYHIPLNSLNQNSVYVKRLANIQNTFLNFEESALFFKSLCYVNADWRKDLHLSLFSFLNVLIPSRKCSIKPPTKRINSVYVLTKNWHLESKYLNDYLDFFDLPELYDRNARPNKHSSAGSLLFTQLLLPSSPTQFWIKW